MKCWPTKPLSELLTTLENGARPKGGVGELPDGIPSLGGEHINSEGGFEWDTPKHVTRDFYAGMKRGRIQVGDILVVKDGATTGKTATVHENFPFREAAINEHVFLLRTDTSMALPEFVGYFLFGPVGQQQILSSFHGAAIGGIAQDFVHNVHVPLAPLAEQERIVKLLDEADELRKLRAQVNLRTADLIPALFHQMFGDPDVNPKKLPIVPLGNLLSFRTGKLDSNAAVEDGAYPFFTCSRDDSRIDTYAFDCEALLLAGNNAVGEYSVKHYKGKFNAYQRTYVLNLLNPDHSYGFMQQALQLRLQEMKRLSLGTNTKYLTLGILKNIEVPLPNSALQQEFAKRVTEIRELEAAQTASRLRLENLFQSMLYRAFEGEL
jgi:type I restriction enzyme S subunit